MPNPVVARRPVVMSIINLSTGVELAAQFNPTELEETLDVAYNSSKVVGMSHTILQYANTENHKFTFELRFEAMEDRGNRQAFARAARRFLLGLCYPRRGAQSVVGGAPARALFIWPGIASLTSVIRSLRFKHGAFNFISNPIRFDVAVTLEEIRDVRLFAEDVEIEGTFRASPPADVIRGSAD